MARKLSKRKQPEKEKYQLKENEKLEGGVFDKKTLITLSKFFNHRIISEVLHIISTGKEADVYLAKSGSFVEKPFVSVKIFRVSTSSFHKRINYMYGDSRVGRLNKKMSYIVNVWCKKEFGNLKLANELGASVPKPIKAINNILAMEFIGDNEGIPALMLKDAELVNPKNILFKILENVLILYNGKLVHSDLSEYNILLTDTQDIYLIDFGQAVIEGHPKFNEFLARDLSTILNYFSRKYNLSIELEKIEEAIKNNNLKSIKNQIFT
ncbi:MAG: RIO1 family regulatory kinase/ATPase [Candidatus Micrarchaeaceae archaeon]